MKKITLEDLNDTLVRIDTQLQEVEAEWKAIDNKLYDVEAKWKETGYGSFYAGQIHGLRKARHFIEDLIDLKKGDEQ